VTICAKAPPNTTELCGLAFEEPPGPPEVVAPLWLDAPPGWTGVTGLMSFLASDTCWQFQQT